MDPRTWDRIQELYYSAVPLPRAERNDFVARACEDNQFLTREVCSLLQASDATLGFLEVPVFGLGLQLINNKIPDSSGESFDPPDRLLGLTIDRRYVVESSLAHGGMARVYLARDLRLHQRQVVIKVLLDKSLRNEWIVRKFHQESEALARVDHPAVVNILDVGELPDKKPYLTMQFIEGISLRAAIADNPEGLEFGRAAAIIKGISSALNAVHQKGIYHRDLKPENIMLQRLGPGEEQVKVLDFGIAKVKGSLTGPSTTPGQGTVGTAAYMSPEQLHGEEVTAASDIYSLAIIAYEMLTGRRPFVADTIAHLAEMQRRGVRVKPSDLRERLPKQAEEIILRGLAFDPGARDLKAGEFGDQLARALTGDPAPGITSYAAIDRDSPTTLDSFAETGGPRKTSQTNETTIHSQNKSRTKRWLLVAAALLVVMIGTGTYWLVFRKGGPFSKPSNSRSASAPHRSLNYSLTVQKMRNGMPYQDQFDSSGEDFVFASDYRFRLNVSSRQAGYLYVFNEGPPENGKAVFNIIYPTTATNDGSSRLEQNQKVQTNWNTFAGGPGTEHFWIIWSVAKVPALETAKLEAFDSNEGAIATAGGAANLKKFLFEHSDPAPETTTEADKQQTNLYAGGDLLVKLVELKHQ